MQAEEKINRIKNDKLDTGIYCKRVSNTKTLSSNKIHKLVKMLKNEILNVAEDFCNLKKYEEAVKEYDILINSHCK